MNKRTTTAAAKQLNKRLDLSKLTPAQRRIEIAKDVIAALNANKIKAERGEYLHLETAAKWAEGDAMRPLFGQTKVCNVCALGAVFVAKVARFNEFNVGSQYWSARPETVVGADRDDMQENLRPFFSVTQLESIECAFEMSEGFAYNRRASRAATSAKFGLKYKSDDYRMRSIMQNIIDNGGEFRP